ncbi:MAG TPA: polysaccharide deacetylase family protein [Bryobacteraceae bacterium]|nr:polysaccharide deacetylase family protein [Bryobacteraceae bacterium]
MFSTEGAAAFSGAAVSASAFLAWAVRGRSAAVFGPSFWRGPRDRAAIALTFDDGPSEGTPALLDVLARHNVSATFFQCGANVERLPHIARAVAQAGHEIGNHSYSHPLFCFHSSRFMEDELRRAQQAIAEHSGAAPVWFRPPYGARWFGMGRTLAAVGLRGVMWTAIGYDWKLNGEAIVGRLAYGAANGSILCLHDGRGLRAGPDIGATLQAVGRLVPMLLDRGYRFETVSRLLCPTN